jgi:hypothetical protein
MFVDLSLIETRADLHNWKSRTSDLAQKPHSISVCVFVTKILASDVPEISIRLWDGIKGEKEHDREGEVCTYYVRHHIFRTAK